MSTRDQPHPRHNGMPSHQSQSQQQSSTNNRGFTSENPVQRHETTGEDRRKPHEDDNTREFTPEGTREAGRQDHEQGHAGDRYNVSTRTAGSPERQHAEAGRLSHKGDMGSASQKH
jgi:hypothetical protein